MKKKCIYLFLFLDFKFPQVEEEKGGKRENIRHSFRVDEPVKSVGDSS